MCAHCFICWLSNGDWIPTFTWCPLGVLNTVAPNLYAIITNYVTYILNTSNAYSATCWMVNACDFIYDIYITYIHRCVYIGHVILLELTLVSHEANSIVNGTFPFLRSRQSKWGATTFFIMLYHWHQCQHHMTPIVSLYYLAQDD